MDDAEKQKKLEEMKQRFRESKAEDAQENDLYEALEEAKGIWEEGGKEALKDHLRELEEPR